jgi:hypothetical protein
MVHKDAMLHKGEQYFISEGQVGQTATQAEHIRFVVQHQECALPRSVA